MAPLCEDLLGDALSKLKTETLLRIINKFNIPHNYFKQGTWNGCIFNQITGKTTVNECAQVLDENSEYVDKVITYWDKLIRRQPNKVLRDLTMEILTARGVVAESTDPINSRVKSIHSVVKFESSIIDHIELVSTEEIDNFLKEELFANV